MAGELLNLHEYQEAAADRLYEMDRVIWVADMGAGKTVTSLTALQDLGRRAIIWAPQRVAQTVWEDEARKFGLLPGARIVTLAGLTPAQRLKALAGGWDVLIVNYELADWVEAQGVRADADTVVIFDELSKLKSATGKRRKKVMKVCEGAGMRWGLTGTPKGNREIDLWGQADAIEPGAWHTFYRWRATYFRSVDANGHIWKILPGCAEVVDDQPRRGQGKQRSDGDRQEDETQLAGGQAELGAHLRDARGPTGEAESRADEDEVDTTRGPAKRLVRDRRCWRHRLSVVAPAASGDRPHAGRPRT